ncbi:hypothetical protein [Ochrobactrum sp. SFR4]|uniref:hypothetical protein n=1 Tax=Ochrobactrum sp. SFR4 TaxID=2717368 RepID=UPI001C8BEFB4|nr:hypothetical protein [Ochrobactrum sp. SFR4]MBX8826161.1 hypothetical protein [Ochrobactrum sp. SFR4]
MSILFTLSNTSNNKKLFIYDNTGNNTSLFQYEAQCNIDTIDDATDSGQIFAMHSTPATGNNTFTIYNPASGSFLASSGFQTTVLTYTGETAGGITFLPAAEKLPVSFEVVPGQQNVYILNIVNALNKKLYLTYDEGSEGVTWLELDPAIQVDPPLIITWKLNALTNNSIPPAQNNMPPA